MATYALQSIVSQLQYFSYIRRLGLQLFSTSACQILTSCFSFLSICLFLVIILCFNLQYTQIYRWEYIKGVMCVLWLKAADLLNILENH